VERFCVIRIGSGMPRFFFDFDGANGTTRDEDGEEMSDMEAARHEAMAALGEAGRDFTRQGADGRLVINVRDDRGPVLSVSATFETLKPTKRT